MKPNQIKKCKEEFKQLLAFDPKWEEAKTALAIIEEWEKLHEYYKDIITQIHNDHKAELAKLKGGFKCN